MATSFRNIRDGGNLIVLTLLDLPISAPAGTLATISSTTDIYVFDGSAWQLKTASGSAGVASFNGRTGVVSPASGDYTASEITNVPSGSIIATDVQAALNYLDSKSVSFPLNAGILGSNTAPVYQMLDNDSGMYQQGDGNVSFSANGIHRLSIDQNDSTFTGDLHITGNLDAANFPQTGSNNTFAGFDGSGNLESIPGFFIDTTSGGMNEQITYQPNNLGGGYSLNTSILNLDPLQNSPSDSWVLNNNIINFDINDSGFNQGTNGEAAVVSNLYVSHQGTGNAGTIVLTKNAFDIGNGTDPITVKGISYSYGFGTIAAGVTLNGPLQGHGFQPNVNSAAVLDSTSDTKAFYDFATINGSALGGYTSYMASPTIGTIPTTKNFNGLNVAPNITTIAGTAGFTGVGIFPQIGTVGAPGLGSFNGIQVSPTITSNVNYAAGININMNNVTNAAGTPSTLVVQDITYTFYLIGDNNNIQIRYTDTVTAGNEVAGLSGNLITVQIESGVSTATQVKAAMDANVTIMGAINSVITGTASNPQTAFAAVNFAGGTNPGQTFAIDATGDVRITGGLSFTGTLGIGKLNSYAAADLATMVSGVNSISQLITAPSAAANLTISGSDLLGVNTAMLMTIGDNTVMTSNFLGFAALGLPAVVSMGTGSSIDRVEGAVFAISLDGGSTGGTISEVSLCRALAIPNGTTTVTKLKGYSMDLPFGDPGTTTWGVYIEPTVNNYMAGNLKIGGSDTVSNSSVGLEVDGLKAVRFANMTTTQKLALTPLSGMMVFDTTLNQMSYYNGTSWVNI